MLRSAGCLHSTPVLSRRPVGGCNIFAPLRSVSKFGLSRRRSPRICRNQYDEGRSDSQTEDWRSQALSEAAKKLPFSLICGIASLGALETAYLTAVKLFDAPMVCPTGGVGCEAVIFSEYAQIFGIPLPALGFLGYCLVAYLAVLGQRSSREPKGSLTREAPRWALLAAGGVMATTSAALMFILFTKFPDELCPYCILSALLSCSLFVVTLQGFSQRELQVRVEQPGSSGRITSQEQAAPGAALLGSVGLALAFNFGSISNSQAYEIPYQEPVVDTHSTQAARSLAKRLKDAGAVMYGAFWCSHCYDQKVSFGQEALQDFPYIECYPDGFRKDVTINPQCNSAGIKGFPTWVIGGRKLEGEQTFDALEAALQKLTPAAPPVAALPEPVLDFDPVTQP